jgi:hypothetical protein
MQVAEPGPEVVEPPTLPFSSGSEPSGGLDAGGSNAPASGTSLQESRVEAPVVPGDQPIAEDVLGPASAYGDLPSAEDQPIAEDVLGPASAFAANGVAAPTQSAFSPPPSTEAPSPEAPSALPSVSMPDFNFNNISPGVLAVGGGAVAAGVGAAGYLAATKVS